MDVFSNADPVSYTLRGLEPGTSYTITVSATTGGGEGDRSNEEMELTRLGGGWLEEVASRWYRVGNTSCFSWRRLFQGGIV